MGKCDFVLKKVKLCEPYFPYFMNSIWKLKSLGNFLVINWLKIVVNQKNYGIFLDFLKLNSITWKKRTWKGKTQYLAFRLYVTYLERDGLSKSRCWFKKRVCGVRSPSGYIQVHPLTNQYFTLAFHVKNFS